MSHWKIEHDKRYHEQFLQFLTPDTPNYIMVSPDWMKSGKKKLEENANPVVTTSTASGSFATKDTNTPGTSEVGATKLAVSNSPANTTTITTSVQNATAPNQTVRSDLDNIYPAFMHPKDIHPANFLHGIYPYLPTHMTNKDYHTGLAPPGGEPPVFKSAYQRAVESGHIKAMTAEKPSNTSSSRAVAGAKPTPLSQANLSRMDQEQAWIDKNSIHSSIDPFSPPHRTTHPHHATMKDILHGKAIFDGVQGTQGSDNTNSAPNHHQQLKVTGEKRKAPHPNLSIDAEKAKQYKPSMQLPTFHHSSNSSLSFIPADIAAKMEVVRREMPLRAGPSNALTSIHSDYNQWIPGNIMLPNDTGKKELGHRVHDTYRQPPRAYLYPQSIAGIQKEADPYNSVIRSNGHALEKIIQQQLQNPEPSKMSDILAKMVLSEQPKVVQTNDPFQGKVWNSIETDTPVNWAHNSTLAEPQGDFTRGISSGSQQPSFVDCKPITPFHRGIERKHAIIEGDQQKRVSDNTWSSAPRIPGTPQRHGEEAFSFNKIPPPPEFRARQTSRSSAGSSLSSGGAKSCSKSSEKQKAEDDLSYFTYLAYLHQLKHGKSIFEKKDHSPTTTRQRKPQQEAYPSAPGGLNDTSSTAARDETKHFPHPWLEFLCDPESGQQKFRWSIPIDTTDSRKFKNDASLAFIFSQVVPQKLENSLALISAHKLPVLPIIIKKSDDFKLREVDTEDFPTPQLGCVVNPSTGEKTARFFIPIDPTPQGWKTAAHQAKTFFEEVERCVASSLNSQALSRPSSPASTAAPKLARTVRETSPWNDVPPASPTFKVPTPFDQILKSGLALSDLLPCLQRPEGTPAWTTRGFHTCAIPPSDTVKFTPEDDHMDFFIYGPQQMGIKVRDTEEIVEIEGSQYRSASSTLQASTPDDDPAAWYRAVAKSREHTTDTFVPIRDIYDHIYRCVVCDWEVLQGRCTNCNYEYTQQTGQHNVPVPTPAINSKNSVKGQPLGSYSASDDYDFYRADLSQDGVSIPVQLNKQWVHEFQTQFVHPTRHLFGGDGTGDDRSLKSNYSPYKQDPVLYAQFCTLAEQNNSRWALLKAFSTTLIALSTAAYNEKVAAIPQFPYAANAELSKDPEKIVVTLESQCNQLRWKLFTLHKLLHNLAVYATTQVHAPFTPGGSELNVSAFEDVVLEYGKRVDVINERLGLLSDPSMLRDRQQFNELRKHDLDAVDPNKRSRMEANAYCLRERKQEELDVFLENQSNKFGVGLEKMRDTLEKMQEALHRAVHARNALVAPKRAISAESAGNA